MQVHRPRERREIKLRLMLRCTFRGDCPNCVLGKVFAGPLSAHERCPVCGMRFDVDGSNWLSVGVLCCMLAVLLVALEGVGLAVLFGFFPALQWTLLASGALAVTAMYRPLLGWWIWLVWSFGFLDLDE
ncbi:MAG TPA: hypothetical protein PLT07_09040 [Trueperaceae bacterium]|nr:hypothetical protein [Trueperaceae bacterium]